MSNTSQADFPTDTTSSDGILKIQGTTRDVPLVFLYGESNIPSKLFITKFMNQITDISVNYSISAATAITFSMIDPGLEVTKQNYFQVGQTFIYRSHNPHKLLSPETIAVAAGDYMAYFMEVADVSIDQQQGNSPIVRVQGYTKAIQQMKRDRTPGVIKGENHHYVENAAKKYGLKSVVQPTTKDKSITQADGEKMADSVWDVLTRLASESKDKDKNPYIIFESDGTLYFCTQQWLMYKWGHDEYQHTRWNKKQGKYVESKRKVTYLHYPPRKVNNIPDTRLLLHKLPSMHKAENDPLEGDGSCIVDRLNGVRLRPGMTVNVGDVPWFTDDFLITSVDYQEMVTDPVSINFATPPRQEKKIKQIDVGKIYPGSIEWATVEGLHVANPTPRYATKTPNSEKQVAE
jgi:hypothetical protein